MKPKTALTVVLLLFVLASVVYLIAGKPGRHPGQAEGRDDSIATPARHVIAYYFHGNVRCPTCRKIEAYAQEAIKAAFADELKTGRLQWQVRNVEEPENDHFVAEYQLTTRSLVLSDMDGTTQRQWKNLDRVWDLVGDKPAFSEYVQGEVRGYLAGIE